MSSLFQQAAENLSGTPRQSEQAKYLKPTPESFFEWLQLLHCDRMYVSSIYERFYDLLVSDSSRKLVLLPRGSFKSTAMCAAVMRDIVLNPNIRILYVSETFELAKFYLGWVKRQFESNADFKDVFGDWVGKKGWGAKEIWVAARTDLSKKEPTLTARGIEQVRAGPHFDKIYVDDPVSFDNSRTPAGLKQVVDLFGALEFIAEDVVDKQTKQVTSTTCLMLTGTRYDDMDVYGHVMRQNETLLERRQRGDLAVKPYEVLVCPAETPDGELPFAHLTREVLDQKRDREPDKYPSQMLLDPVPPGTALFQRGEFKLIATHDMPRREFLWFYMLSDTATSQDREDFTVLVVVGFDPIGNAYIVDMVVKQMKPSDVTESIFSLYTKWGCRGILMEKIAINECYAALLEGRQIQTQTRLNIIPVGGRTKETKFMRIRSLQGRFQAGKIFFSAALPRFLIHALNGQCYGEVVEQFVKFPKSKLHDDIPDALSDMDKQDNNGSRLCRLPPKVGPVVTGRPSVINGRLMAPTNPIKKPGGNFWGNLRTQLEGGPK